VVTRDGFEVKSVPEPTISDGEVLLRIKYGALCYRDLLQLKGFYTRMRYPVILGHEAVGTVEKSRDSRFSEGDRVIPLLYRNDGTCPYCMRGLDIYCRNIAGYGEEIDGFFAEMAKVSANSLVKVPSDVTDEAAVMVPCIVSMIYKGLRRANLRTGEVVLVTGAGGGVGVHAIQVAKAMGARVIANTRSEGKARELKRFADEVIVGPKFSGEVKRITGDGADIVIENVGTPTLEESMRSLRRGGRVVLVGNVDPTQVFGLRLGYAILKDLEIIGNSGSSRPDLVEGLELMRRGLVKPIIARTIPLESFNEALAELNNESRLGKVLITP